MPDTSAASQKVLSVSPATADVMQNAVCHFTVDPRGTQVKWEIKPRIGDIDENGIYSSPSPTIITMDPDQDEKCKFTAMVMLGSTKEAATWAVEGGGEIDADGTFHSKTASIPRKPRP